MKPLSLATLFFTATALAAATAGAQQAARPIRVLNQFQAGGGADAIVRPLLDPVATDLGRPVLMDYKPGAAGAIAAAELEKGAPDGSTLIIDTQTLALNTVLRKVNYRHAEWEPIALLGIIPLALLTAQQVPAATLAEFVAHVRRNPAKVTYATLGPGSAAHLAALRLERQFNMQMLAVPYKGTGEVHQDLLGGRIDVFFDGVSQAVPRLQKNQLKILGVSTVQRMSIAPQLATFKEQDFDMEYGSWFGLAAPKGTPADVVNRIADSFIRAAQAPDYVQRMTGLGVVTQALGPQAFAKFRKDDLARWADIIQKANIVLE